MRVGATTHVGFIRERNEDALLVAEDQGVFVVADGLGGHVAGDVASRIAVARLRDVLTTGPLHNGGAPSEVLHEGLQAAHDAIADEAIAHPDQRGMATTAVVAYVDDGGQAWVAHVGDSRAYLVRDGGMLQLTEDHTSGGVFERGAITQALGTGPISPDVQKVAVEPGDRLLLCTDGLTDMLDDEAIAEIAHEDDDPQAACEALVEAALENGGFDNVTVVLVSVDEQ